MKAEDRKLFVFPVLEVLRNAHHGRGAHPHFLTAYQVLERLQEPERSQLIAQYGRGGKGAGTADTAPGIISQILGNELWAEVEVAYIDARGVRFIVENEHVEAGYPVIALYKLRERGSPEV